MNCPVCGGKTTVKDCKSNEDSVWRRRECLQCKHRFNTHELDEDYYKSLKPIDKKAVQMILQDSCTDLVKRLYKTLNI
jgi:transcriptional regulator NrdR family protein